MTYEDRRKSPRTEYECHVLIVRGADGFIGSMADVSAIGCRITRPEDWSLVIDTEVRLFLLIDLRHAVSADAKVVWADAHHVGFEYLEPQPLPA